MAQQKIDETVPGGQFIVGGQMVNANGEPVKGAAKPAEKPDYAAMKVEELKALAEKQGVEVKAASGDANGRPNKADYVAALEAA